MSYIPPTGAEADFTFGGAYIPPAGNAADLVFADGEPAPTGSGLKAHVEGGWVDGVLKRWSGTAWEMAALKYFDGNQWVLT